MEKKNYIVESEKENKNAYLYNYSLIKTVEYLEKKYKKPFYTAFGGTSMVAGKFFHDLKQKKLEVLGTIQEYESDAYFNSETEKAEDYTYNTLYYFPEYELAYGTMVSYSADSRRANEAIFYSDMKKYEKFMVDAKKRQITRKKSEAIVYTDTMKGIAETREKITGAVERNEVIMEEEIKESIYKSIDNFFSENESFYKKYNIPHKRGILLYGEPGNGKTTLVKSIAGSIDSPVIYWQINEYTSSASIQKVFEMAGSLAPAVLVIEDLDSMPAGCRSTFLNTLDGATTKEGIFLIGTTNYPERIDKALINRAGRFDRTYEIKLPNEEKRFQYLLNRGTLDFFSASDIKKMAEKTEGLSVVQLNELFITIAIDHHSEGSSDYEKVIKELKENNRKSSKNDWKAEKESSFGFH